MLFYLKSKGIDGFAIHEDSSCNLGTFVLGEFRKSENQSSQNQMNGYSLCKISSMLYINLI